MPWCLTWQDWGVGIGGIHSSNVSAGEVDLNVCGRLCSPPSAFEVSACGTRLLSGLKRSWGFLGLTSNLGMIRGKVGEIRSCVLKSCGGEDILSTLFTKKE